MQDGIKWHDIECRHKKPIICQESQELLDYALGDYEYDDDYYYDYQKLDKSDMEWGTTWAFKVQQYSDSRNLFSSQTISVLYLFFIYLFL